MKWDCYDVYYLKKNYNYILCYIDNYFVDGFCLVNEEIEYFFDFFFFIRFLRVIGVKIIFVKRIVVLL